MYFLVTMELLNKRQDTKMNDDFNCTSVTIPHFQSDSFLGHQETVQGYSHSVPKGSVMGTHGNCMGTKTTPGVTVHFTIKSHKLLSPHPAHE